MQRIHRSVRERGFTLIEALVVVVIISIIGVISVPAMIQAYSRAKLRATARETAALMQLAKIEAVRRNSRTEVCYDAVTQNIFALVDQVPDPPGGPAPCPVPVTAPDLTIGVQSIPQGVVLRGPLDGVPFGPSAIQGFDEAPCLAANQKPGVVFLPDGSTPCAGALRFMLTNNTPEESDNSFIEVRVAPTATGRIHIQKFFAGQPVGTCSLDDPRVGGCWWEFNELGNQWTWP